MDFLEGQTLLFNKPLHWTSFDLVKKVRNTIKIKKVGHAGTLDPLATGLMIICTGKHTKTIDSLTTQDKEYIATFCLGATTPTYDAEFPPENQVSTAHVAREMIEEAMKNFVGEIAQYPPAYSAVHVNGKRAYELARKGQTVALKARTIHIYRFEIVEYTSPEKIVALVHCSKGTYIRSLIHDLGQMLGVGGYLTALIRTKIGEYRLENAWELEEFISFVKEGKEKEG